MKLYTRISKNVDVDTRVAGATRIVCEAGGGWVFGKHFPDGQWRKGDAIDADALERFMWKVPKGTPYLSNLFEDQLGSRLLEIGQVLAAAKRRGLRTAWFGLPGLRFGAPLDLYRERNDLVMRAIGPLLDMVTSTHYFSDVAPDIEPGYRDMLDESLTESIALAGRREIAPVLNPLTHDGRPVPVEKTLALRAMHRARGIESAMVWTDQGDTPHVRATVAALKAA